MFRGGALCFCVLFFFCLSASAKEPVVFMDAAECDKDGQPFEGFVAIRLCAIAGDTDLTNIRFKVDIRSGILANTSGWLWDDPLNPWYGATHYEVHSNYNVGYAYFPPTQEFAPFYSTGSTQLIGTVPAGCAWDICLKLSSPDGSPIELFSTAEGYFHSDQMNLSLTDEDSGPQTVPEPATLAILIGGSFSILIRKQRRFR